MPTINQLQIEEKLQTLRKEWVTAKISRRQVILLQARALKIALSKLNPTILASPDG